MKPIIRVMFSLLAAAMVTTACGSSEGLFGKELYEQSCQSCHQSDGSGGTGPAIGIGSNSAELTDEQIAGVIRIGPGVMPSFGRLTDAQVASLVEHVRSLQGNQGG